MAGETYTPEQMLARLVAFDTTSHLSNLELIEFVAGYLAGHGVSSTLVHSDDRAKANLIATVGPAKPGGVVLSGHTDVVPVRGQAWDTDPFTMTRRDARLYGRGTADMKGFIACALAAVPAFLARPLTVPIHLAFSYDEEVGCLGARPLLERLVAEKPRPLLAIIGEPSGMKVANAHRGVTKFATTVTGRPGHSSDPAKGVNAIQYAALCIAFLGRVADEMRALPAPEGAGDFDPAYSTINVGTVDGGQAVNIIAGACRFTWDCRAMPGTDGAEAKRRLDAYAADELLPRMRAAGADVGIVTEETGSVPPLNPEPGSPAEALLLALTGQNTCTTTPFGSEGGLFQQSGIPAVICGPGSVAQAHQPNEFVSVAQLDECAELLGKVADWAERG
ncbi:MAG: acetylornithine deacetylase [Rhodospirillales bacterium]